MKNIIINLACLNEKLSLFIFTMWHAIASCDATQQAWLQHAQRHKILLALRHLVASYNATLQAWLEQAQLHKLDLNWPVRALEKLFQSIIILQYITFLSSELPISTRPEDVGGFPHFIGKRSKYWVDRKMAAAGLSWIHTTPLNEKKIQRTVFNRPRLRLLSK